MCAPYFFAYFTLPFSLNKIQLPYGGIPMFFKALPILFIAFISHQASAAKVKVVTHLKSNIQDADNKKTIARIYTLKKLSTSSGEEIKVFDLNRKIPSKIKNKIYKKITGKRFSSVRRLWSRSIFSGKGATPEKLLSDRDILEQVSRDKNAIGILYQGDNLDLSEVKVSLEASLP